MGLLTRMLGGSNEKLGLIRRLLKERIRTDPNAKQFGQDESFADSIPDRQLLGLPEATIVTCVESWSSLRKRGLADGEVVLKIAAFRNQAGAYFSRVEDLIEACVKSEHGHSGHLTASHVKWCIKESKTFYRV